MKNEKGEISSLLGVTRDITEQKESQKEIIESEEKRRLIMTGALDAIICILPNQEITFWNPQAEVLFGWKESEALGQLLPQLIIPEPFRKFHEEGVKNYIQTGNKKVLNRLLELTAVNRNGEAFPIELTVIPIEQGDEVFFCAFIRDISQRKKAEQYILKANERFEKVTEATNDAIWDWDLVNNAFYRSKAIENFFGKNVSKQMKADDFWKDNFHSEDIARVQNTIDEAISDPTVFRWEAEYRILNEKKELIFVIDRGIIIRNEDGKATRMVGAMTNITAQKQLELRLSELNHSLLQHSSELERSNEELEQFAFIASHDLQEPLRMISSFMDQLKRKYEDRLDEKGLKYIHFATDGAKRMKQIILDLLDFSRAGKMNEELIPIDLNLIVEEYEILRRKIIKEKRVVILKDELPIVKSFRVPIAQAIHCLMDNAIKYSKNGIVPQIEIRVSENDIEWIIEVKDNGIGIETIYFNKIFVIFQRLHDKDKYGGTGIGLSIAKKNIESCNGKIWVESAIDIGSSFYFTINKI